MTKFQTISDNPEVQAHYEQCRRQGTSHTLAEMMATQIAPFLMTDKVWNEGRVNGSQFQETKMSRSQGDAYKKRAERAGVSTTGKTYMPSLANAPGDPEAWVSDRGDVRRLCEKRGYGCPEVGVKMRQDPLPEVDVAEDVVQELVEKELEKDPGQRPLDVREKVKAKARPHWKSKQA